MSADTQLPTLADANSQQVRGYLVEALRLDLVGPDAGAELAEERLPGWVRPSNWYLTGFLVPSDAPPEQRCDADEDDPLDETPAAAGLAEESSEERTAAKRGFFPSSIGLSFLVADSAEELQVTVRWGDYRKGEYEGPDGDTVSVWQREPQERTVQLFLAEETAELLVPESGGLRLHVAVRQVDTARIAGLHEGTRSVSVFLVNNRPAAVSAPTGDIGESESDQTYAFQAELEVSGEVPFVARPDPRGALASAWDDQVADLHYADVPEYAVGHGTSADWQIIDGQCLVLRTAWIPAATVAKTETASVADADLSMERLGALADGPAASAALQPLVSHYRAWIASQREEISALSGARRDVGDELLRRASLVADRIERGIQLLAADLDALDAFRVANRAVARALRRRSDDDGPRWRAFQLAFILLNVGGLADRRSVERQIVDLLFFPTGGGKTEAYLGLAAFAIVLRRLRHPGQDGFQAAGVTVIMRYTLRLLTLDQLGRAASLVCALELEREADPARYGAWPIEIGLWVGKAATPNVMGHKGDRRPDTARSKTRQFKSDPGKPTPIPLESCPWCGTRFEPASFTLLPDDDQPSELRIVCVNFECDFSGDRSLPILAVDEPIYRRLPAFLIATVDKFASLPFTGQTGALLGGAARVDDTGFYGASEPKRGRPLERPLAGPDLVIQDELHLISGPLGTMAGLYETAIEALCAQVPGEPADGTEGDAQPVRPKIVASTATIRQAQDQIQALFARSLTEVFPSPGPDRRDSFFAQVVSVDRTPGRMYLGIAAPGRNPKVLMRRVWLALMGAAERAYRDAGGHRNLHNPADPYMTVLGYFNSLRELGGARRILEEEVQSTVKTYGSRKRIGEVRGLFRDRRTMSEVVELTSRVSTDRVAQARARLSRGAHESGRVDSAIATNMISVGLDIGRLGLMVVLGQPKTHAEYIQATSRVGRVDDKPGLVVTLLNVHKPRDRSHYERFRHYHETFYRSVEVSSVTPFSARALDRGLAGALVGLARHTDTALTPARGVESLATVRPSVERALMRCFGDRVDSQPFADEAERAERRRSVRSRVVDLLDSWITVIDDYRDANAEVQYQRYELRTPRPLLREMLEEDFDSQHQRKFRANRSLRDVEPEVDVYVKPLSASRRGEGGSGVRQ
ncbi:DISARM system helicase DrmA [Candidatus Poriferisodalis sp.]|uniref:DISARM system helicase DrmA n=1 Tax=Candidatus Poriferisodalis sp. TaxID=3101277 RepID=UPI003B01CD0B